LSFRRGEPNLIPLPFFKNSNKKHKWWNLFFNDLKEKYEKISNN